MWLFLIGLSLSFSPISATGHFQVKNCASYLPGKCPVKTWQRIAAPGNHQIIWSPQAIFKLSGKRFDLITGGLIDSEGGPAFPLMGGAHFNLSKSLSFGFGAGPYIRFSHYPPEGPTFGPRAFYARTDGFDGRRWELLPLYLFTGAYSYRNTEISIGANHTLLNLSFAFKIF